MKEQTIWYIPAKETDHYSVVDFIPSYADHLAPKSNLRMTTKHEFGHALGLGHYITEDQNDSRDGVMEWKDLLL